MKRMTLPIDTITDESGSVRTFTFRNRIEADPGQFVMLTDFRGGEKPFSIADRGDDFFSVSVKAVGPFTRRLFHLKEGDYISIRGAYGSSFFCPSFCLGNEGTGTKPPPFPGAETIQPGEFKPVLAGGGFGIPPLYFLASRLIEAGVRPDSIIVLAAARTEGELLFKTRFTRIGVRYIGAVEDLTENGSDTCGGEHFPGTASAALEGIDPVRFDFVYASGSDLMMKSLLHTLPENMEYQFLFERYMKCAIGICGSCVMDPGGLRICKEGPALYRKNIEKLEDFGVYRRTATGEREFFVDRFSAGRGEEE